MLQGLYTAAAGMLVQQTALDTNSNNLANASTTGFRRQLISVNASPHTIDTTGSAFIPDEAAASSYDLSTVLASDPATGITHQTGNPTDFALRGDGFFVIRAQSGAQALTRDGSFTLNSNNELATLDGWTVMGTQGAISIDSANWTVDPSGQVVVDGNAVDRLQIVVPSGSTPPTRIGDTRWSASTTIPLPHAYVEQGYLESSNVNTVAEMVSLITASRAFESNQRCVQAYDSLLERTVNDIGRVA